MSIAKTSAHFIGIGGIGMSALAELFHQQGAKVTGSDMGENAQTEHLKSKGIEIFIGHDANQVNEDLDVVVFSSAIKDSNPEIQRAKTLSIPLIQRAEALAEIMRHKRGIAVGGTHGKTTTTSIISSIFMHSEFDPTIAVGGRLKLIESTARLGKGPWMVAEADESDGSFARLQPEISIITNIDSDHMDYYGNFENLQKAFRHFALNIPYYGCAIVFGDDPKIKKLFEAFTKRILFYGFDKDNDYSLVKKDRGYEVFHKGQSQGVIDLAVPGQHNALNALAACIATNQAGVPWEKCLRGANSYSGVDRRFQKIGEVSGVQVFDDYAHHPTEIAATCLGVQDLKISGKFHLIYQPHRYTRTRDCWQDYLGSFDNVDQLYLVDIYPAGEDPIEGITSEKLASLISGANYVASDESLLTHLKENLKPGDIVMTMGAGKIWQMAHQILKVLKE